MPSTLSVATFRAACLEWLLSDTLEVPKDANYKQYLHAKWTRLLTDAVSSELLEKGSLPGESTIAKWYCKRWNTKFRSWALSQIATARTTRFDLPVPLSVSQYLTVHARESLFQFVVRFNEHCQSPYKAKKAKEAVLALKELKRSSPPATAAAVSVVSGPKQPFVSAASTNRTSDYLSSIAHHLARQRSVEGGLRSLREACGVVLEPEAVELAECGIVSATTARKVIHVLDEHYNQQEDVLIGDQFLTLSADTKKIAKKNWIVFTLSCFLRAFSCVYRSVFAVRQITDGSGAAYDKAKQAAFARRGIREQNVGWFLLDGASANVGAHQGLVRLSNERVDTPLSLHAPCLEHGSDLAFNAGVLGMCGADAERKGLPKASNKFAIFAAILASILRENPEIQKLFASMQPGGRVGLVSEAVPSRWHTSVDFADYLTKNHERMLQIAQAILKQSSAVNSDGSLDDSKLSDDALYALLCLCSPLFAACTSVIADLGALTVKLQLRFLNGTKAFNMPLLVDFAQVTALRYTALLSALSELESTVSEADLAEARGTVVAWQRNELAPSDAFHRIPGRPKPSATVHLRDVESQRQHAATSSTARSGRFDFHHFV